MAEEKKEQPKTELTEGELRLISQVLYQTAWTGQQWQQVITPLLNKIAKRIDEIK